MFKNYLRTALRNLMRHRSYAAINILGLALGLAAFWMIALYVADELSFDRFHANKDRIYRVVQHVRWNENELHVAPTSAPFAPTLKNEFPEIQAATRILPEGGGAIKFNNKSLNVGDIYFADKNLFGVFSFPFLYGDPSTALSEPQSLVITEKLAANLFGEARNALNQTVYFENNFPNKVTGIIKDVPQNSHLQFSGIRSLPADFEGGWQNYNVYTYLLLKPGAKVEGLEAKLPALAAKTIQKMMQVADYKMELQPLTSIHLHSNLQYEISVNGNMGRVYLFITIALLILIVAIINYMNLTTARSAGRVREVGVRKVVGSGKGQLAGLFITESVVVTLIASAVGLLLVRLNMPFFNMLMEKQLTMWRFGQATTLSLVILFSIVTGILSGIYPSLFLARFKTMTALKGQMGDVSANVLFRKSMVVFQFVITVGMIAGSLVINQQLKYASNKDLGFNKDQVLTLHIDNGDVRKQTDAIKNQLLQNPSVEAVAVAGNPIGNNNLGGMGYFFEKENGGYSTGTVIAHELMADEDYVPAMEIKMQSGRNFSKQIKTDKYGAALVNETLVKKLGWKNPIGKRMKFPIDEKGGEGERTVVGVVHDFHTYSLQHKIEPLVMVLPPDPSMGDNLYVRLASEKINEGLAHLKTVYSSFDKENTLEYHFLDQNFSKQYAAEKKQSQLALAFTVLSVLIACLGLFGLAAFSARQRIKEIGIRKVLGAGLKDITGLLTKEFVRLVVISILIASPIAWWMMQKWLQDFAYQTKISWWIFVAAGILALVIAIGTVSIQAIKAAMANPVKSLRTE